MEDAVQHIATLEHAEYLVDKFKNLLQGYEYYMNRSKANQGIAPDLSQKQYNEAMKKLREARAVKGEAIDLWLDIYNDYMDLYNNFKNESYKRYAQKATSTLRTLNQYEREYKLEHELRL